MLNPGYREQNTFSIGPKLTGRNATPDMLVNERQPVATSKGTRNAVPLPTRAAILNRASNLVSLRIRVDADIPLRRSSKVRQPIAQPLLVQATEPAEIPHPSESRIMSSSSRRPGFRFLPTRRACRGNCSAVDWHAISENGTACYISQRDRRPLRTCDAPPATSLERMFGSRCPLWRQRIL